MLPSDVTAQCSRSFSLLHTMFERGAQWCVPGSMTLIFAARDIFRDVWLFHLCKHVAGAKQFLNKVLINVTIFQISPGRIKYQLVSKNHILKNKMNLWMSNNPWSGLCKRVHWLFAGRHDVWLPRLKFAWLSNKGGFKLMLGLENPSLGSGDLKRESHGLTF